MSYGSPLLAVVGLKPITEDLGTQRQLVALVASLTWFGTGLGGIFMGQVAERIGIRATVMFGATMIALGLAVSATGNLWAMLVGHAVLVGFLGNGALYPPLIVYVSRWFDRRRGTALALISSGQYIAGMGWPTLFEYGMRSSNTALQVGGQTIVLHGWQTTMLGFACLVLIAVPIIAMFLQPAPEPPELGQFADAGRRGEVLGLRPNTVLALICAAGFCCCVPMSIPQGHLVAFCSDIGIPAIQGAAMLSVLQASAFVSRVLWGWLADRIGGLKTVLLGSVVSGAGDRRVYGDAGRGRAVRDRRRLRLRVQRHHPGLCDRDPRAVPVARGVVAGAERAVRQHGRDGVRRLVGRRAVRPFRLLRPGLRCRACCSIWRISPLSASWSCASAAQAGFGGTRWRRARLPS